MRFLFTSYEISNKSLILLCIAVGHSFWVLCDVSECDRHSWVIGNFAVVNSLVRVFSAMSPARVSFGQISVGLEGLGQGYVNLFPFYSWKLRLKRRHPLASVQVNGNVFPTWDNKQIKTKTGCLVRGGY